VWVVKLFGENRAHHYPMEDQMVYVRVRNRNLFLLFISCVILVVLHEYSFDMPLISSMQNKDSSPTSLVVPPPFSSSYSLPLSKQKGEWIGNSWVPPSDWKLYNSTELLSFYESKSILYIGDSTCRRTALVLYEILDQSSSSSSSLLTNNNKTKADDSYYQPHTNLTVDNIDNPDLINVNRSKYPTEKCNKSKYTNSTIDYRMTMDNANNNTFAFLCRDMPASKNNHEFLYLKSNCWNDLENFLTRELESSNITGAAKYDAIVIAQGVHEATDMCGDEGSLSRVWDKLNGYAKQNEDIAIVWRTTGWVDDADPTFDPAFNDNVENFNQYAFDEMEDRNMSPNNLGIVDWGGAIRSRSYGAERIKGDTREHYGLSPRLVSIQMITNKLQEMMNA